MKASGTYKFFANFFLRIRTWSRRTIWGDRLFLQFSGPSTILIQSRASRVSDVLTAGDVNEIADAPAGIAQRAIRDVQSGKDSARTGVEGAMTSASPEQTQRTQPKLTVASVSQDGKVTFEAAKDTENVKK